MHKVAMLLCLLAEVQLKCACINNNWLHMYTVFRILKCIWTLGSINDLTYAYYDKLKVTWNAQTWY